MNKDYSVLMTVYFKETVSNLKESIDSMLNQTLPPKEFLLVADGVLTEELDSAIESYVQNSPISFKVVRLEKNQGSGLASAIGIENCSYEWIARMDSDDISLPTRCEKQLNYLEKHPEITLIGSGIHEFEGDVSNIIYHHKVPEYHDDIYAFAKKRAPLVHPTVIFKKSEVLAVGNYRTQLFAEDYDIMVRLLQNGVKAYNFQESLVLVRVSPNFFNRRGGRAYYGYMHDLNKKFLKSGWYSLKDYVKRDVAFLITCFIPNSARIFLYKKLLRK